MDIVFDLLRSQSEGRSLVVLLYAPLRTRRVTCDEHPKKMTTAQIANPRSDVPSEVRSQRRQHLTLEISPFNHNDHRRSIQGLVICNRLARCDC